MTDPDRQTASQSAPASVSPTERKPKWWHYFIAGELGGMAGSILCHPFDTTKTRVQMLAEHRQSTLSFMRSIAAKEGVGALYRGMMYPFFGFGVLFSISFGTNGLVRNHYIRQNERDETRFERLHLKPTELSMSQLMVGGVFAGAASSIFRTPIERVKCWSQIHGTSTIRSTFDLLRNYGLFKGLWYGMWPTLTREVPQFAVYYPIYEATCAVLADPDTHGDKSQLSGWKIFVGGASAGVWCWIITYPIDVVKTRIQAAPPGTYRNMFHCAADLWRSGGVRIYWNGIMPTIYRAAALHSAIFVVYERVLERVQAVSSSAD